MLFDEIGDQEAFKASAAKLKAKESQLKSYINNHEDLHRRKDREQVVGFNRSVSAKAVAANKNIDRPNS